MRNDSWLRFGLTSLMAGTAIFGAVLVACSDDDKAASPKPDSGTPDSGTSDAEADSGESDSGPKSQPAKLQVVNAATDMGPDNEPGLLRFCYEVAPNTFPLPPIPDTKLSDDLPYPGVPIGAGGVADTTGASLASLNITPYLMNAKRLFERGIVKGDAGTTGVGCSDIFGAEKDAGGQGPLVDNVDYWKLPPIAAGALQNDKSYILVLTGCPGNSTAGNKCGADFTATGETPSLGNLKVTVYEADRATAIDTAKIGTQFIHASPAGALAFAEAGGVIPGYTDSAKANFKPATADGGVVALKEQTPLLQVEGVNVATDHFTANPGVADLSLPLSQIQTLSFGANVPDGGGYRNGAAFTFIAIGDPDGEGTKQFHYIALPNDPTPKLYK